MSFHTQRVNDIFPLFKKSVVFRTKISFSIVSAMIKLYLLFQNCYEISQALSR